MDNPIQLIVGSFEETSGKYLGYDETHLSGKQKLTFVDSKSIIDNIRKYASDHKYVEPYISPRNKHFCRQSRSITEYVTPIIVAKHDKSNETNISRTDEQVESKGDIQKEVNASLQQYLNSTSPPLWFTEYMESVSNCKYSNAYFYISEKFSKINLLFICKIIIKIIIAYYYHSFPFQYINVHI